MVSWSKGLASESEAVALAGLAARSAAAMPRRVSGGSPVHRWLTRSGLAMALLSVTGAAWAAQNPDFTVGVNTAPGASATVAPGAATTVRITLTNDTTTALTNVTFASIQPQELAPTAGNNLVSPAGMSSITGDAGCVGGTVTVSAGSGSINLSGFTVPAKVGSDPGVCYIDVPLRAVSTSGASSTVRYSLPRGAVTVAGGDSNGGTVDAEQNFTVSAVSRPTWEKEFLSDTAVLGGGTVNLTLRVNNPAGGVDLTGVTFEDIFPVAGGDGAVIEPVSVGTITPAGCVALGNVALQTGSAAKVTISNMSVARGTSCSVTVAVSARHTNSSYQLNNQANSLLPASFSSAQGLKPASNATDTITVRSPLQVDKSASPVRVASGETGTFNIRLSNNGSTALTVNQFNETTIDGGGQSGVRLTPTGITNSCGGTNTFTNAAGGGIQTSAYSIPAGGSCLIAVTFIGTTVDNQPLTFTNSIPQGAVAITGQPGIVSQERSAAVTLIDELFVDKSQTPAQVAPGNPVQYSVTVSNFGSAARNNLHITDNLQNNATFLTGMFAGVDRSPTSNCGMTTSNALGDTALDFLIPALPAAVGNAPGQCTVTFWALTDPNGSGNTRNQIGVCGVWYGASQADALLNHTCNGRVSNEVEALHQAPLLVGKTFNGTNYDITSNTRPEGTVVTLRIRLRNYNDQALTGVNIGDTFPAGLKVANLPNASSTCGGDITAAPNSSSLVLNNAQVPARTSASNTPGSCVVQVDVVGPAGSYPNTANVTANLAQPAGNRVLTADSNQATLTYTGALNATKAFMPTEMTASGKSQVRIRLSNSDLTATLTGVAVTDPLTTAGLRLADPAGLYTTCGGNPVLNGAAGATAVSMSGVVLPPGGSCDLLFDVVNDDKPNGNWINTIPVGNLTADGGINNTTAITATLTRSNEQIPTLSKEISPTIVAPGQPARLKIEVSNGSQALSGMALTDYFTVGGTQGGVPNGMQVASPANASTTCPGGAVTAVPGSTSVSLTGATLPAKQPSPSLVGTCSIELDVVSTNPGAVVNTIPQSALLSDQGQTNSSTSGAATLQTSKSITLDKGFNPAVIAAGQRSRLRISFLNSTVVVAPNFAVTDNLPGGMTVPAGPNIVQTCGPNTVVDVSDNTKVRISKGTLPGGSAGATASCYVELDVTASVEGEYVNHIPSRSLTVDGEPIDHPPVTDTQHVRKPLVLHKAIDSLTFDGANTAGFTSGTAQAGAGEVKTLTLYLHNPNIDGALSEISVQDNLPTGLVVAQTPNVINSCGGVVTAPASATLVRLTGASLAFGASCTVQVDVLSNIPGRHVNSIPAGAVSTKEGVSNAEPTSAALLISTPPSVGKQFSPAVIPANGTSKLTIVLNNPNITVIALTQALVDNLPQAPGSMKVATPPNMNKTCPGTVTANAGETTVTYADGAQIPVGGCTIEVDVTADLPGDYNNNIPAGGLQTDAGNNSDPANAPLKVSTLGFISGKVFADNNLIPDGLFNGTDAPLPGVTIELRDGGSCSDPLVGTTATDAQGNYLFAGLAAGTYSVCQPGQPVGTSNGITTPGTNQAVNGSTGSAGSASNPTDTTSQIIGIVLNADGGAGEVSGSVNNNFAETIPSSISGKVFLDRNNDGNVNGTDAGIPGQIIELWKDGSKVTETTTDADGNYRFDDLPPGDYTVIQPAQPDGTSNGKTTGGVVPNGTPGTGSNPATTSSQIATIKLPPNTQSTGNNFAELPGDRSISGQVFIDFGDDGALTPADGDKGIGGQEIRLTGTDTNGNTVERTTTTAADGSYRFDNLPEGTYTVTQPGQPDGTTNGDPVPGTTGGVGNNPTATSSQIAPINLVGANTTSVENNFPELAGAAPDLQIIKTSLTDMVAAGSNVPGVFTLSPSNIGSVDTSGVITITDNLPAGMTLAEQAVGAGWICPAGIGASMLSCTSSEVIAAGAAGAPITVKVLIAASADGQVLVNTARVSGGGEPDGFVGPENQSSAQVSASEPARISGTVWRDNNHDRLLDADEPRVAGVQVELMRNGVVVATAVTGADGKYSFGGLPAGSGYDLRFRDSSGAVFLGSVTNENAMTHSPGQRDSSDAVDGVNMGNPAGATIYQGALKGMRLMPGDHIIEQSLPLDPSGVVYDAVTRQPVAGAVVTLTGPGGADVSAFIVGGQSSQVTGVDGLYQFWLSALAPIGEYRLEVTQYPAGYLPKPSTLIPACQGPGPNVGALPDPALVQQSDLAPAANVTPHDPAGCQGIVAGGVPTTQHYFSFVLTPGVSANVLNNHIPLDPILGGAIVMTKVTPKVNVTRGELVPYTLTARNTLGSALSNVAIEDQIPPGFQYVKGSAQVDGIPMEPVITGRLLRWPGRDLAAGQAVTVKLLLVVGSGVGFNEYVNQTWALSLAAGSRISNVATASVRVVPDPTFDCSDLIGTVFDDQNRNGYQDEGEPGLPGVRLATPRGWLVTTDKHGRYHIACADVPSEIRGSNFILKVDERSLPSGYRIVTENPRVVRMTQGRLVKANFGASIHRVVRLDLTGAAFDGERLTTDYLARMDEVLAALYAEPSILRIAYHLPVGGDVKEARARIGHVQAWIKERWEPNECCYDLQLEEEIVPATESVEVIR
jgi:uncharacterized repeat protein (TIGR01451 family)